MKGINEGRIKSQAWKFYFVLFSWPVFLFLLPWAFSAIGGWAVLFVIFPGFFLYTWLGYLMHETWHKYVPNIPNRLFYYLYSWMLVTDPQVYQVLHKYHHSHVNSWDDSEFHPTGRIGNTWLRRVFNVSEILFGIVFLYLVAVARIPFNPQFKGKFKPWSAIASLFAWVIFYGGIGFLSGFTFHIPVETVAFVLLLNLFLDSFFLHQSQLVEHGNLIVEGDFNTRNRKTRNLRNKGPVERIFLFLTHWDSAEHVLHHTHPAVYTRPFPGSLPFPEDSVTVTFAQYLRLLWDMILGR
jgi:fatty acid desaturase